MRSTIAAIDNLLFLLLIAIAALFRLLAKAAGSKRESTSEDESTFPEPESPEQQTRTRPQSDEEQIRKFLEALGQPRTANVPPPVTPRTDVPPRPVAPVQPPRTFIPVPKTPAPQPTRARRVEPTEPRKPPPLPPRAEPVRPRSRAEVPTFEVRETTAAPFPETESAQPSGQTKPAPEAGAVDPVRMLRTPGGLRQAIILREIFGTPRGLQSMDELPGTS